LALTNIDDLMNIDPEEEIELQKASRKNAQAAKKIYPVSICFHQKSKLLAISLVDCDIKIYQIKSSGSSLQVINYHSFYSTFIPCTSHLSQHKINDNVILTIASRGGQVEIYSLDERDKGTKIHSIKMQYSPKQQGPVTKIMYHRDVGLIVSTFKGMIHVYDSMEFKLIWETVNGAPERKDKLTITTFDYSQVAGLIAVGGVEGQIALFDPSAKILTATAKKHESEIMDIYFYDKQMQLVSVGIDRVIMLWDSLKLECVQVIKDSSPQSRFYSSTCFNNQRGVLLTADVNIKVWSA
jgi:WD40 repeat protein